MTEEQAVYYAVLQSALTTAPQAVDSSFGGITNLYLRYRANTRGSLPGVGLPRGALPRVDSHVGISITAYIYIYIQLGSALRAEIM